MSTKQVRTKRARTDSEDTVAASSASSSSSSDPSIDSASADVAQDAEAKSKHVAAKSIQSFTVSFGKSARRGGMEFVKAATFNSWANAMKYAMKLHRSKDMDDADKGLGKRPAPRISKKAQVPKTMEKLESRLKSLVKDHWCVNIRYFHPNQSAQWDWREPDGDYEEMVSIQETFNCA
jgi:hypothetical protein